MRRALTALIAGCCVGLAAAPFAAEPAAATALKAEPAPTLDGRLDEPLWRTAPGLGAFRIWEKPDTGRRTSATDARLAYDNAWLYVGFRCANPLQPLILAPKTMTHDGPVSQDESVELFFTADPAGKTYYHFMLSCFNVRVEQRFLNGVQERETWNQPWRSATVIDAKGWTAEIAIPLYLFLEYGDLDHVRMNVTRNRRCPVMDANRVVTHESLEYSVWRPVLNSFHEVGAFGALVALHPDKLQVPFLVSLENVQVRPYFIKEGANSYQVDVTLKSANPTPGEAEVVVTDRPVAGSGTTVRERVGITGLAMRDVAIAVPAPMPAERTIAVEVRDVVTGEPLQAATIESPACLKVMDAYLDRNYYTSEAEAVAVAEIAMAEEMLKGMTVAVEIGGKGVASAPAVRQTRVRFPLQALAVGTHPVSVMLKRPDGAPFCTLTVELVKREPKPGHEVKIDQVNRVVLKDGVPVFPFGPVMGGIGPGMESDYEAIAAAGCNTFFQWDHNTKETAGAHLAVAKRHGLQAVALLETGWPSLKDAGLKAPAQLLDAREAAGIASDTGSGDLRLRAHLMQAKASPLAKTAVYREYYEKSIPAAERMIADVKDSDCFLAYNSFDEPFSNSYFMATDVLADLRHLTQRLDGYHPVMLNYSSYIPEGDEYVTSADILCTDPYWVPGGDASWGARNSPNFVSKIVTWTDQRAAKLRKATWIIPLGATWSNCRKRMISGPEQDCQNFLAVIHGARGLFWFCYPMPELAWNNLRDAIRKIQVIGPMAIQPAVKQTISHRRATAPVREYKDAPFIPEKDEFPDVQGRVFRDPQGGFVLLAANSRYYPVTATFTVAGFSGAVENLFGGAKLAVKAGAFGEELAPFAVRAYRLDGALPEEPIKLTLAALRPAQLPPAETAFPNNARAGVKNVFPNPSFEEETIPGAADYYHGGNPRVDTATPRFGKKCLRLTNQADKPFARVYWHCGPRQDKDTAYTWSFWAKGAKGGELIWTRAALEGGPGPVPDPKRFTMTADWQRYEVPVTVSARSPLMLFDIRLWCRGEAWLDGMQLEKGEKATEFEE